MTPEMAPVTAMPHDNDAPSLEQPDPDRVYRNYLEACRRRGVEPVPRERAAELMAESTEVIERSLIPPITH